MPSVYTMILIACLAALAWLAGWEQGMRQGCSEQREALAVLSARVTDVIDAKNNLESKFKGATKPKKPELCQVPMGVGGP